MADKRLKSGTQQVKRDAKGRFVKGQSGNVYGRTPMPAEMMELARASAPKALELAARYIDDDELDPRVRLKAAELLLDRGYGKPAQSVSMDVQSAPRVVFVGCDNVPD